MSEPHPVVTATLTPCPECNGMGARSASAGHCSDIDGECGCRHPCLSCNGTGSRYVPNPDEEAVAKSDADALRDLIRALAIYRPITAEQARLLATVTRGDHR